MNYHYKGVKNDYILDYFNEVALITYDIKNICWYYITFIINTLIEIQDKGGRVFILGLGGSAGNASHMVNDLRKLCNIEAYAPTDNISELTARANDEGFENIFVPWLKISKLNSKDCLFVLSVGGGVITGDSDKPIVSASLIHAIDYAKIIGVKVVGICGKSDGYLAKKGDYIVVVPEVNPNRITPHCEEFQAVIWHCIVSHPDLARNKTVW